MKPIRIESRHIVPGWELERADSEARIHYIHKSQVRSFGDAMLEANTVEFEARDIDDPARGPGARQLIARAYVLSNDDAATIEAAEKKRVRELVDEIIDEGLRQVDNWGSYFHRSDIEKYQVALLLRAAVESKLGRRQ